ncbi:MAG: L-2-amino-thiazoline-4-carboxylic acid hydrolase [Polyangiales bacterium]
MDIVKLVYGPLAMRAARRALVGRVRVRLSPERGRFTREDVARVLDGAWRRYDEAVGRLPTQPTRGSAMNVRLACFTVSVLDELLATGAERDYTIELVADATWRVYRIWARLASVTGSKSNALAFAAKKASDREGAVSLRFPFNAPGYVIEEVVTEGGTGFDVVHCPVASYFRERGAVDLCTASWCNLDFALSEMTHQKLVRTKTLVRGADRCDFRILPRNEG